MRVYLQELRATSSMHDPSQSCRKRNTVGEAAAVVRLGSQNVINVRLVTLLTRPSANCPLEAQPSRVLCIVGLHAVD